MEQRDFLMKQVEQLGLILGKIFSKLLNLKDSGTETASAINQIFTEELDFSIAQLSAIDDDQFIDALKNKMNFDDGNLEKLADILLFVADLNAANEANLLYKKSLIIYQYLEKNKKTYSLERNLKIEKILAETA